MDTLDALRRLLGWEAPPPPVPEAPPEPVPVVPENPLLRFRPQELYDHIVERLGFDPEHPGWFEELRALHVHTRRRRLQLIPDFFYTPVFAPADLTARTWDGTFPLCGEFRLDAQEALLRDTPSLRSELADLGFEKADNDAVYHWGNDQFSHADAGLYYALIRRFRPGRVVEIGAGHSTKLAARAVRANGRGTILCIDPNPPAWLSALEVPVEVRAERVQDTPESVFQELAESDVLFIDGSHISKTGSDVNHMFLRVLPALPAGVLVQVHDVCLPFEYPKTWSEDAICYWNEQYVLAALMADRSRYEVVVGTYFLHKTSPELLRPYIPEFPGIQTIGGSLWIRTRADAPAARPATAP